MSAARARLRPVRSAAPSSLLRSVVPAALLPVGVLRPVLGALGVLAALAGCPADPALPQSEACALVLEAYFPANGGALAGLKGFETFPLQRDAMIRSYGPEGDCWRLDEDVARQCDHRCRDLLFEDCLHPFDDVDDGSPVAEGACEHPPRCSADAPCPHDVECQVDAGAEQGCCKTTAAVADCGYPTDPTDSTAAP